MKRRTVLRIAGGSVLLLAVLLVAGWLAFVPWAKEPGYAFVTAWGGKGGLQNRRPGWPSWRSVLL